MKRNDEFILRNVADDNLLIPIGEMTQNINGLITLNPTAVFIWEHINECGNEEDLIKIMLEHFEGDKDKIVEETRLFFKILKDENMIID